MKLRHTVNQPDHLTEKMGTSDALLDVEHLPRDWYTRLSGRLVRYASMLEWNNWPDRFRSTCVMSRDFRNQSMMGTLIDQQLPDKVNIKHAYHFLAKTATFYTILGGDWDKPWRINEQKFPICPEKWMALVWKLWTKQCREHGRREYECYDARFVIAPLSLSRQDDERFSTWLGLGKVPGPVSELDMEQLIAWHVRHCYLLHARANATIDDQDHAHIKDLASIFRHSQKTKPLLAPLAPTFRAVFMLGRNQMSRPAQVLLVLTGHNEDMKSGPVTSNSIPRRDVVSWRTNYMIEVSLETAIGFLQELERREEASNHEYRSRNEERRRAIYNGFVEDTWEEVQAMYRETESVVDTESKLNARRYLGWESYVHMGWEALVMDERRYDTLVGTAQLRGLWHHGEDQSTA